MSKCSVYLAGCYGWYYRNKPNDDYYRAWREEASNWFKKYTDGGNTINPLNYFDYNKKNYKSEAEN